MKKALLILLTLTMILSSVAIVPFSVAAEDELAIGAVAADYKPEGTAIKTAAEFAAMDPAGTYYLANDITVDATYTAIFTGVFDGNGKTITTTVPVFEILDGTAKNVTITGNIVATEKSETAAENYVGALAKCAGNTAAAYITNVCNKAFLTSTVCNMGGVVGIVSNDQEFDVIFTKVANYGNITGGNGGDSGGIAGLFDGNDDVDRYYCQFIDCYNYGTVNTVGRPGGIIGYANASTLFENCYNAGAIQSAENYSGGMTGRIGTDKGLNNLYKFVNCTNDGDVIVYQKHGGGMVGYVAYAINIVFENCTNNGSITYDAATTGRNKDVQVGGLFGAIANSEHEIVIENCVNNGYVGTSGTITSKTAGTHDVGGLVGFLRLNAGSVKIINCVNNGEICANDTKSTTYAGGLAGRLVPYAGTGSGDTIPLSVVGCINNGEVYGMSQAGGMVAHAFTGSNHGYITFEKCGNTGSVDTAGNIAGGIVGEVTCNTDATKCLSGANVIACFNVGSVHAKQKASGLIGYTTMAGVVEIKYNYVAGDISSDLKPVEIVLDENNSSKTNLPGLNYQTPYYVKTKNSGNVYFYVPYSSNVDKNLINTVTLEADDSITVYIGANYKDLGLTSVSNGSAVATNGCYTFETSDGKTWITYSRVDGAISIVEDKNGGKPTVTVGSVELYTTEWTAEADGVTFKNWPVTTTPIECNGAALIWTNMQSYDLTDNYVMEGLGVPNAYMGFGSKWGSLGDLGNDATMFTAEDLASGALAVALNDAIGEDVFRQNLDSHIFIVDAYPTTDATHAIVYYNGAEYTNPMYEINSDVTPPTGDATVYVVIALAVSVISLAALAVVKKRKEN